MMKKMLILVLGCLLLLSACSMPKQPVTSVFGNQETVVLYFANSQGTDLIPVNLNVYEKPQAELPGLVMEKLLEGPTSPELSRAIRLGTKLLTVAKEQTLVKVDVSKEFYHEESIYDVLAISSIVKSLCSISGVDSVFMTVEGQPLLTAEGTELGILKESDVVFDADALTEDESNITLYFSDTNAEYLTREIRQVKVPRGELMEKIVLTELINGPKGNGGRTIPQETKIRSVETKDKVCFVNLSSEFITKNNVGIAAEQLTIYSIVNSLTELSNVDKVQFLIEGEKKDVYLHMIFNEPIARDVSMIQK